MALAGVAAGVAMHGYIPGRVAGPLFAAYFLWLWIAARDRFPGWKAVGAFAAGFVVMAGPVIWYALVSGRSHYWHYVQSVNPNRDAGAWRYLSTMAEAAPVYLGMLRGPGDPTSAENLPYVSLLNAWAGGPVIVGLLLALAGFWRPIPAFLLGYIVAGFAPSMLGGGFAHPTDRRVVFALPPLFLLSAVAFERLRLAFTTAWRPLGWVVHAGILGVGLAGLASGLHWYFKVYSVDPSVLTYRNVRGHEAGIIVHQDPALPTVISPLVPGGVTAGILFPPKTRFLKVVHPEDLIGLPAGSALKLALDGGFSGAEQLIGKLYPGAKTESVPPPPGMDLPHHFGPSLLIKGRIPAEDLAALPDLMGPQGRLPVGAILQPGVQGVWRGVFRLEKSGGPIQVGFDWPGWRISVNDRPVSPGARIALPGGFHRLRLQGKVPAEGGALPLSLKAPEGDLLQLGRLAGIDWPWGWSAAIGKGDGRWGSAAMLERREMLAVVHFYDEAAQIGNPFFARLSGHLKVPASGEYRFSAAIPTRVGIRIAGREVYDSLEDPFKPQGTPLRLTAGQAVPIQTLFWSSHVGSVDRVLRLMVQGPGDAVAKELPLTWLTLDRP
jgi:hypothetical protein